MNTLHIIYILLSGLVLLGIMAIVLLIQDLRRIAKDISQHLANIRNNAGIIMGSTSRIEEMSRAVADPFMEAYKKRKAEWIAGLFPSLLAAFKKPRP